MKLIACSNCHTQYDVSEMAPGSEFECRCGGRLEATAPVATDAAVHRCSGCGAIAKREADETCEYCGAAIIAAVDHGSLICPECYARNLDGARFCLGCGVGFDPQSPRSSRSELRCPCCERWMHTREVGGLEIEECPKCHGLWAPERHFDTLVERAAVAARERSGTGEGMAPRVDGDNPAASKVEYRRCPVCDALMNRRNFQKRSGVIVDRCAEHGTWLDAHELERIAGFVLSGRAASAARAEASRRDERERQAAREAARRSSIASARADRETGISIFGERRPSSTVDTIFDLLTTLLN